MLLYTRNLPAEIFVQYSIPSIFFKHDAPLHDISFALEMKKAAHAFTDAPPSEQILYGASSPLIATQAGTAPLPVEIKSMDLISDDGFGFFQARL